ncbi:spore germination lipoprotein GerD [Alkalihalobacillus trypoxylicola]|uniref:Spore gernimation protein GerD n=1 Tax=Alkalihalobacillus trypoxylicola TaxID=519424 RepID=A0A161PJ86_9BACI|nr:spore germination lipoprotein GerD [Alkalihalobacillus trypoxylicola]KYG33872.1 spore gernimation protein GerD [Alkalihalobacillus trypoxylicola]
MNALRKWLFLCLFITLLSGCAAAENSGQADYDTTKKMMVDMLKTDEGKKAIQELMHDEEMRHDLVMDNFFVKETIQETLTTEQGKAFWQQTMKDPEFAKTFAEAMQSENEKILKGLMKDPEYQTMMVSILQDQEIKDSILELLKSKEYREQVMTIMSESFESPYFMAKINEILSNVTEEQLKKQDEEGGSGSSESGQDSSQESEQE